MPVRTYLYDATAKDREAALTAAVIAGLHDRQMLRVDVNTLRPRHTRDLLAELAKLRARVAFIRRMLTPHREVYATMARPDFQLLSGSASAVHFTILRPIGAGYRNRRVARDQLNGTVLGHRVGKRHLPRS